jgi:hypothetical protein
MSAAFSNVFYLPPWAKRKGGGVSTLWCKPSKTRSWSFLALWSCPSPVPCPPCPPQPLKTASGYIVPLPNNQFMYTNIVILLTILYQSFIDALYYCKFFGIKIYVLCLMSESTPLKTNKKLKSKSKNCIRKWTEFSMVLICLAEGGGGG